MLQWRFLVTFSSFADEKRHPSIHPSIQSPSNRASLRTPGSFHHSYIIHSHTSNILFFFTSQTIQTQSSGIQDSSPRSCTYQYDKSSRTKLESRGNGKRSIETRASKTRRIELARENGSTERRDDCQSSQRDLRDERPFSLLCFIFFCRDLRKRKKL